MPEIARSFRECRTNFEGCGHGPEFPHTGSRWMAAHAPIPAVRDIRRERLSWVMEWTPPDGICVPRWRCRSATEGGVHGASYHDRFGHRETSVPRAWSGCCRACV